MNWNLQYEINKNRIGETILYNVLCAMYDGRTDIKIENVACDEECYHLGDIRITNSAGKIYYFDAKNDGRINETGNVFCEDYKKFYSNSQKIHSGFMRDGKYDILCVIDRIGSKIYFINFSKLKEIYKKYRFVGTELEDAISYGYVVPISEIEKIGAMEMVVDYREVVIGEEIKYII